MYQIQDEQDAIEYDERSSVGGDVMDEFRRNSDWNIKERAYERRTDVVSMCSSSCKRLL